jgi:acetate---CoA ligase (ADP-forming)
MRGNGLDPVLKPGSIAVIGASADPRKRGYQAIQALREAGYAGAIYPVNSKGGELLGLEVASSVAAIDGSPDLALVCTPAASVPQVLEDCALKGIRGAVVLALGFGEIGGDGAALEGEIREVARRTGVRVVGPNTSGVMNLSMGLNLIGVRGVRPGGIALLAQSGNMLLGLLNEAMSSEHHGVSICVGVGNQSDIGFEEYLEYLGEEPNTAAIVMYVEGFENGEDFLRVARRVSARKPIVLLKGGRSAAGSTAARSHTGAIAGEYAMVRAALKQVGVVEVRRSDELFAVADTLASQPPVPRGAGVALLSDGGGHATVAADALSELGVPLAELSAATRAALRALLGPMANVTNPIDVAGAADRDPAVFTECLRIVAEDGAVGGVLMAGLFGGYAIRFAAELTEEETAAAGEIAEIFLAAGKPLVVHSLYARSGSEPLRTLRRRAVPVVESLETACRCIAAACERGEVLGRPLEEIVAPPPAAIGFHPARRDGRTALLETEVREVVSRHGVQVVPATLCASEDEAIAAAAAIGGPVVLKVVSPAIPHKTEAGGVLLGISGAGAVAAAFRRIHESAAAYARARGERAGVRGVLVSPMLPSPVAELLVGVRRDPHFGPVLSLGAGGTLVEILRDVSLRLLPISAREVREMLSEIRVADVLQGIRGRPAADLPALVELVLAMAETALAHEELLEIEANPVFAYPTGAVAVDVRAFLSDVPARSPARPGQRTVAQPVSTSADPSPF